MRTCEWREGCSENAEHALLLDEIHCGWYCSPHAQDMLTRVHLFIYGEKRWPPSEVAK